MAANYLYRGAADWSPLSIEQYIAAETDGPSRSRTRNRKKKGVSRVVLSSPSESPPPKARARGSAEHRDHGAMQGDGEVLFLGGVGEVSVAVGRDVLSLQPLHPVRPVARP
jgi:hypothetical protein